MLYEIMQKFRVTLKPDTSQLAYQNLGNINLPVHILKFTDGSIRVTLPDMNDSLDHRYCVIDAFIESADDLVIVAQIKDIIDRLSKAKKLITLNILSTAYTRYDRVMLEDKTDSFGAEVFSIFLNVIGINCVTLLDSHSNVMVDLINNSVNIDQSLLLQKLIDTSDYNLIAPDKGATKKNKDANVIFDKVRDVATGRITGMEIVKNEPTKSDKYIVIDDICEGGRTFIECAKLFKSEISTTAQLDIYVTHGIFSNGAVAKLAEYYDNIYTYIMKQSTYDSLSDEMKSKVKAQILVNI